MTWVTNDPEAAKLLKRANRKYVAARLAAANLPLADKITAYAKAKSDKQAAYDAVSKRNPHWDHLKID